VPNQLRVVAVIHGADQCPGVQKQGVIIMVARNAEHLGVGGQGRSRHPLGVVIAHIIVRMAIDEKEVDMGAMAGAADRIAIMAMRHCQHLGKEQADRRGNEGNRPEHHFPLINLQFRTRRQN
jgi:hypothetical protein